MRKAPDPQTEKVTLTAGQAGEIVRNGMTDSIDLSIDSINRMTRVIG